MVRDKVQCDVSGIFLHFYWALNTTLFVEQKRNVFIQKSNKNSQQKFLISLKLIVSFTKSTFIQLETYDVLKLKFDISTI